MRKEGGELALPGQGFPLTRMNKSFPELVHAPGVIIVSVSRDRDHPLGRVCERAEHPGQRSDPRARVHDQISLRSADVIEVRADQGVHMRLGHQRDAISHLPDRKPGVCHRETKRIHTTSVIQDGQRMLVGREAVNATAAFCRREGPLHTKGTTDRRRCYRPRAPAIQVNPASVDEYA